MSEELKLWRELLDDDGENRAVRAFLLLYGGSAGITIGDMIHHLSRSGFPECWPDWVYTINHGEHLTKAGAQIWIRHLFSMEGTVQRDEVIEEAAKAVEADLMSIETDNFAEKFHNHAVQRMATIVRALKGKV